METKNKEQLKKFCVACDLIVDQVFRKISTIYHDQKTHNSRFYKRFTSLACLNIGLIGLLIEFGAIVVNAYDVAWGLSRHQLAASVSWACACVVGVLFVMTVVLNFRIMWLRINEEYRRHYD